MTLRNMPSLPIATLFIMLLLSSGCSSEKMQSNEAPEGMHTLSLERFGKPFAIFVPDTTRSKLRMEELSSGALHIKVGEEFGIAISEFPADLTLLKEDLNYDEVNKLRQMITDEKNTLVWESGVTQSEFHFVTNQQINNRTYAFEDLRGPDNKAFTRDQIERMLRSAESTVVPSK